MKIALIKQFLKSDKFLNLYLLTVAYGCIAYYFWASANGRKDAMMGVTGAMVMWCLIKNIGKKKWSDLDTMIFIVFGLTTVLIPFIK